MWRAILGIAFFLAAIVVFVNSSGIQDATTFSVYIDLGIACLIAAVAVIPFFKQLALFLASYLAVLALVLSINNFYTVAFVPLCALIVSWFWYSRIAPMTKLEQD